MPWLQLRFTVPRDEADALGAALEQLGAQAITLQSAGIDSLFDQADESPTLWDCNALTALFAAQTDTDALVARLASQLAPSAVPLHAAEILADQDWNRAWMDRFRPLRFGERLWVCPSWHTPPDPDAVNIILDPGMAFGTGTHPTTALCLRWLDGAALDGRTVLDYGCGSGILAIAAIKLGARHVWAVDIDPQCLEVTRENAARNEVSDRLTVSGPGDCPAPQRDVLLANILARPLIELAPAFAEAVRTGGDVVLSGLLISQIEACVAAYTPFFDMQPPRAEADWVILAGVRR
ncbi:MAG: 50S ribosomal protein L11 methyltransferase [Chromatiales bacterium]